MTERPTTPMPPPKDCPKCQAPLTVMLFLGIQPDFYVCETCKIAYALDTLRPVATVIGCEPCATP